MCNVCRIVIVFVMCVNDKYCINICIIILVIVVLMMKRGCKM